jgi:hypothetical protein
LGADYNTLKSNVKATKKVDEKEGFLEQMAEKLESGDALRKEIE